MSPQTDPGAQVEPSRRDRILRVASELFAHNGFRGTPIIDIGRAAGVSGPALYRHFKNKDAILVEILAASGERLVAVAEDRLARNPEANALSTLVSWHVEFALENPDLVTLRTRDFGDLDEADQRRIRALESRYVDLWAKIIREHRPSVDGVRARYTASAVFGLINSAPFGVAVWDTGSADALEAMALAAIDGAAPPPPDPG